MIRKAYSSDAKFIFETLAKTLTPWEEQGILGSIEHDLVFILEGEGVIIARQTLDELEILNFAVKKELRGQGYGKSLLGFLLDHAEKSGVKTAFLDVRQSNIAAVSLYKSFGFEICGKRKNYYRNPPEDAVLMNLNIN
ncbi:MAG: ribosomal protein S18-alanine N-acetyltransferase [Clostridia bacterium]|nr:ribosomal protein S18-alanine N-acetyltransferase [Clostridia bacterium]